MTWHRAAVAGFVFLSAVSSFAAQRTFVSATGIDTNPCSRDMPCRSFGVAIAQTAAGGEVVALDSAGYGPFVVTQPVAVVAPAGVHAGISVFSGEGVHIDVPGFAVVLRNLYLTGISGATGINFVNGIGLHIDHCVVHGFIGNGIQLVPAYPADVAISDTIVLACGQSGVYANTTAPPLTVSITGCHLERNQYGVAVDQALVVIRDSTVDQSENIGLFARGTGGGASVAIASSAMTGNSEAVKVETGTVVAHDVTVASTNLCDAFYAEGVAANLSVDSCTIEGGYTGVYADGETVSVAGTTITGATVGVNAAGGGAVRLSRSLITHNISGVSGHGSVASAGDNVIDGNTTNVQATVTVTPLPKM